MHTHVTKRIVAVVLVLALVLSVVPAVFATEKSQDVVVLYTNDVHCGIDAGKPEGSMGYANLAALKKDLQTKHENVVLVDAGDAIQGEAVGTLSNGSYLVDIMNYVGFDFATFGNHEFDYGMDVAKSLLTNAKAKYLSCNFIDLKTNKTVAKPYEIVDYNGLKVAYVGISTPETFTKSTPSYFQDENGKYIYSFCEGNNGQDLYKCVQASVDAAKAEGAQLVIAIGHLGTDSASAPWTSREVIANTTGLNAFIDGHSHSTIPTEEVKNKDGETVILTSTGTKLQNIGKMTITPDGKISAELVCGYTAVDADTDAYVKSIQAKYEDKLNEVIGKTDVHLAVKDPETGKRLIRSQETNLGDLCADAYRKTMDADIAIVNGGGIRADIEKGDITYGEVVAVHPFGNVGCVVEATGQEIVDALEMSSRAMPGELGGFLQVSGMKYTIDCTVASTVKVDEKGNFVEVSGARRVKDVQVLKGDGTYAPIDLSATYELASHDFMLKSGGDGINMFRDNKVLRDEVMIDNQVLITYIRDYLGGKVGEEYGSINGQGRISVISEVPEAPEAPEAPVAPSDVVVLFTNDVHCGVDAGNPEGSMGYANLAALKKELMQTNRNVVLVDAGDAIQGEAIGTLSNGSYLVDIMNQVGYDFATFGNHEFDYGMDVAKSLLEKSAATYLACNFIDLTTNTTVAEPYCVVDYDGVKIGYVGIATPETFIKSTPTFFQNEAGNYIYSFCEKNNGKDLYDAVQASIDAAKNDGADYVIAIGHLGIDDASKPWTSREVIANTTGLTAFIDGHSHSTIAGEEVAAKDGKKVMLASTGTKLQNIGKLTLSPDGVVTTELISGYDKVDEETDAYIKGIQAQFEDKLNEVVGHTDVDLTIADPETGDRIIRNKETNLGDLCADAYRVTLGADIAFVNGGGIRAGIPAGDITYGQVISVHPFGNMACVVEATGQQIVDALEMCSRAVPGELGGFLHVSGLKYTIDPSVESSVKLDDKGNFVEVVDARRVRDVQVLKADGKYAPIDLNATYKLASHNFMLKSGGDGINMFMNNKVLQDEVMIDNQVLITYIRDNLKGNVGKEYANPYGQGRISIKTAEPLDPDGPAVTGDMTVAVAGAVVVLSISAFVALAVVQKKQSF